MKSIFKALSLALLLVAPFAAYGSGKVDPAPSAQGWNIKGKAYSAFDFAFLPGKNAEGNRTFKSWKNLKYGVWAAITVAGGSAVYKKFFAKNQDADLDAEEEEGTN